MCFPQWDRARAYPGSSKKGVARVTHFCLRRDDMVSPDVLVKATAAENTIRAAVAVTTQLADEARVRQQTAPTASAALGRALTASLLLSSTMKEEERLSLQLLGNGPLKGIFAEANARGDVRGFVYYPRTHLP